MNGVTHEISGSANLKAAVCLVCCGVSGVLRCVGCALCAAVCLVCCGVSGVLRCVGCAAVCLMCHKRNFATFRKSLLPPSSGTKSTLRATASQQAELAAKCNCLLPPFNRQTDRQFIQPILSHNKDDYVRTELTYVTLKRKQDSTPQQSLLYCNWSCCGLCTTICREGQWSVHRKIRAAFCVPRYTMC